MVNFDENDADGMQWYGISNRLVWYSKILSFSVILLPVRESDF